MAVEEEEDGEAAVVDLEEEVVDLEEEAVEEEEAILEVVGVAGEDLEDEAAVDLVGVGAVLVETGTVTEEVRDDLVTEIEIRIVIVILLYFLNIIYIFKINIFR